MTDGYRFLNRTSGAQGNRDGVREFVDALLDLDPRLHVERQVLRVGSDLKRLAVGRSAGIARGDLGAGESLWLEGLGSRESAAALFAEAPSERGVGEGWVVCGGSHDTCVARGCPVSNTSR